MDYVTFTKEKPTLYGQIIVNGKSKIGSFKPEWNHNTNSLYYRYYTFSGKKGTGGFTLKRAFDLFLGKRLSTDSENGNPANYV